MPRGSCRLDVESRGLAWPLPHHLVWGEAYLTLPYFAGDAAGAARGSTPPRRLSALTSPQPPALQEMLGSTDSLPSLPPLQDADAADDDDGGADAGGSGDAGGGAEAEGSGDVDGGADAEPK